MSESEETNEFEQGLMAMAARSESRRARRRFTEATAPPGVAGGGCAPEDWPSVRQYADWWQYVLEDLKTDPAGWWYGWCPLHDQERAAGQPTAMFQFKHGVMRCLKDERCHDARTITLHNLVVAVAKADHGTALA